MPTPDASDTLIERAISIVGWNYPADNFSLKAETFDKDHIAPLECFLPDSQPLIDTLKSKPVRAVIDSYIQHDSEAADSQSRYKRISFWLPVPIILSALISLAYVAIGPLAMADWIGGVFNVAPERHLDIQVAIQRWVPWLIIVGLVATPILAMIFNPLPYYSHWKEHRAAAEALRTEFFKRVFDDKPPSAAVNPILALLLKLEYFRRWQVELQSAYFSKTEQRYRKGDTMTNRVALLYIAFAFAWGAILLAAMVGSMDEQGPVAPFGWHGLAGTMSLASNAEQWSLDRYFLIATFGIGVSGMWLLHRRKLNEAVRNAARFDVMRNRFREIDAKIPLLRQAAARGDEAAVRAFVDRVHSTMSLELADWVRLASLDVGKDEETSFAVAK